MDYQALIREIAERVAVYIMKHKQIRLCFHDLNHTLQVVKAVQKIGIYYQLKERDMFVLTAAAYFHDIGYLEGGADNHEMRSAKVAEVFLKESKVPSSDIGTVMDCIMATRLPQSPKDLLEKIICDADLYHFGSEGFARRDELMRKEYEASTGTSITKERWREHTIQLMERHQFHTEYGQSFLCAAKERNLAFLKADRM